MANAQRVFRCPACGYSITLGENESLHRCPSCRNVRNEICDKKEEQSAEKKMFVDLTKEGD